MDLLMDLLTFLLTTYQTWIRAPNQRRSQTHPKRYLISHRRRRMSGMRYSSLFLTSLLSKLNLVSTLLF